MATEISTSQTETINLSAIPFTEALELRELFFTDVVEGN